MPGTPIRLFVVTVSRAQLLKGGGLFCRRLESRLKATTDLLAAEVKQAIVATQQQLVTVLNKKAFKADVHRSLQLKADREDVQAWLLRKAEVADVRDALAHKADAVRQAASSHGARTIALALAP